MLNTSPLMLLLALVLSIVGSKNCEELKGLFCLRTVLDKGRHFGISDAETLGLFLESAGSIRAFPRGQHLVSLPVETVATVSK